MHRIRRQDAFVKRPPDRAGKDVLVAAAIAIGARIEDLEKRIEIVRRLIVMIHEDRAIEAGAGSDRFHGEAYRRERVEPLRRSIVGDDDRAAARAERRLGDRALKMRPRERTPN